MGIHRRHAAANILVNALVPVFLMWGITAAMPAHAAPRSPAVPPTATATETAKVTLPETSIAGPGFDRDIAWTGTDAAHHLNVRFGGGGLAFSGTITLPETSPFAPAITLEP